MGGKPQRAVLGCGAVGQDRQDEVDVLPGQSAEVHVDQIELAVIDLAPGGQVLDQQSPIW